MSEQGVIRQTSRKAGDTVTRAQSLLGTSAQIVQDRPREAKASFFKSLIYSRIMIVFSGRRPRYPSKGAGANSRHRASISLS